jgi:predicted transcriptional regulator
MGNGCSLLSFQEIKSDNSGVFKMKVTSALDKMISEIEKSGIPAEHIIMGKNYFYEWIIELTRTGDITLEKNKKKYKFTHKGIKIIICESDILEVVPNPKHLLD